MMDKVPSWLAISLGLCLIVLGFVLGVAYTEDKYRDVATCPTCDGRGVVTTREATALPVATESASNDSARLVRELKEAEDTIKEITEQMRTDRLCRESE